MALFDFLKKKKIEESIDESIPAFKDKGQDHQEDVEAISGEGIDDIDLVKGFGTIQVGSFNTFYRSYINKSFENERMRILGYRQMAATSEIADVIEDAVNETTQEDDEGKLLTLEITDNKLSKNKNMSKNIFDEFNNLFYNNIDIIDHIWDMVRTYFIDGRVYYERIINSNNPKEGIIGIKKLPSETMDYLYEAKTGKITQYFQYLTPRTKKPLTIEEAEADKSIIVFNPEQIGFINYGIYGRTRHEILGFLEKARIPYNQLKLLETSVIIYRIVRSPERFVFRIDTGNMPKDKALKFVEKIKSKFSKKQSYDPSTGRLTHEPEILSLLENFFLPQSADGRGSTIETVGGDAKGFTELDDIYYFARKLFRSIKYPMSRVVAGQENRQADIMFGGSQTSEIQRDEVKWSKFLERQQKRFCKEFNDLFLLHLEFRGLKKEYELNKNSFNVHMNSPSHYKEQMEQNFLESRFNNYTTLSGNSEFSKVYLMKKYLRWNDDEIEENVKLKQKDKDLGFDEEGGY